MAKFYGSGTGANRGYWELQWRDRKGRWIEMGSIGRYVINGITYTGRMIGGDSADSINIERRTADGKIVEGVIDKINPKDFENLNVKALLDAPDGFTEEEVAQARRAANTRPKAASYPNGTKLTIDGEEHTKNDADTWVDPSGAALKNADIDSRMDSSSESSAKIPDEAEITQENILNSTDGSQLTWNNKKYSRLDGKWYDEKTGKPVTDKTMAKKTDGDLSTEGGKSSFTPTPASEYEPGTKLRAENESGDDSADLEKTADNAWDVETEESSTSIDDATTDRIIESADYLDDLSDFLQNPTESEPTGGRLDSVPQLEKEIDDIASEAERIYQSHDNQTGDPYTDEENAKLEELSDRIDKVISGSDNLPDDSQEDVAKVRAEAEEVKSFIDEVIADDPKANLEEVKAEWARERAEAEKTNEPPRVDVETDTDEPVDERIETLLSEIDRTDDKEPLEDIERELADLDNQLKDSENNDDVIARERIAEARVANNEKYAAIESQENATNQERISNALTRVNDSDNGENTSPEDLEILREADRELEELDSADLDEQTRKDIADARKEIADTEAMVADRTDDSAPLDIRNNPADYPAGTEIKGTDFEATKGRDGKWKVYFDEDDRETQPSRSLSDRAMKRYLTEDRVESVKVPEDESREETAPRQDRRDSAPDPEPEPEVDDIDALPEEELPEEDVDTSGYDPDAEDEDIDWDSEENPLDSEPDQAPERTTDDILSDLDTTGAAAIDAISDGSDDDLAQARTQLLDTYQEAQRAIDSPDTSNEDKVRLQSKVEEVDRAVTAIDQEIESRRDRDPESTSGHDWEEADDNENISIRVEKDGAQLEAYVTDEGEYLIAVYPPGSDDDVAPYKPYETLEEAQKAAQDFYASYDPDAANRPESHSDDDLEGGYQADPEPNDETLSSPDVETVEREVQEAAEDGTLNVEEVDPSADFTPTPDIPLKRSNAEKLANLQEGDIIVTASGRRSIYENGQWRDLGKEMTVSNEAQKEINKSSSETIAVGSAGEDVSVPFETAFTNKHDISLQGGQRPDNIRILNEDGTSEVYTNHNGRWHRRLDTQGNLSPSPTSRDVLHGKINASRQVVTQKKGAPVTFYGEKELTPQTSEAPTPSNVPSANEGGGLASPEAKHVPASPGKRPPLGSDITERPAKTEPNKVLTQNGKRVGMSDSNGNTYFVGDRVIYTDRSNNVRSARITAVSERGKDKKPAFDMVLDEHDPDTLESSVPFDEWYAMTGKERVAAGLPKTKYSKTKSMYQDSLAGNMRHATDEDRNDISQENQSIKEQGLVAGVIVNNPEFLEDVSTDRVVRDQSTAIIGTVNKHGELFQRGEVVEYGPNGEVGTIVHIGEADDRIRIAPDGKSALESVYYHVDTISHSKKPATYYDRNYDLDPQDRVARDRFNNELRVGDTVYRYGFPFTVKDIYPDGSKIRVVGQDWAGEQGSKGSLSTSQLIDLGFDSQTAMELSGDREHDFMPDHLQVFSGNVEDIKSIRTHDSHMMTLTRDSQGRVLDTQENRDALASRALGTKSNAKLNNSAIARYIAENGDTERYERDGIKPGDSIDSGIDQAAGDNLQQYVDLTFGTDMVIPDNSRMLGYNRFGQYETYTKKDNRWYIDGVEGDNGMSAQEFYQYRLDNGYIPNPDGDGDSDQFRMRLSYLGDADDHVVPKPGSRIKKTDDEKFALMPVGSIVRFTDAEGNIITIRKGPDGQWYKVTQSGAFSSERPVEPKDVPGTATYRGHANKNVPLPKTLDTTSEEAKRQGVEREARQVQRNNTRRENGGIDRIYGTHITAEDTFREGVANTETVRDNRLANERLAAERDELARQNQESSKVNEALREALRKAGIDPDSIDTGDDDSLTASASRIVATRKGTDHILAVYNRVSDNVWEYVSAKGHRREFVLEAMPSTPGVTYKVEEHVA